MKIIQRYYEFIFEAGEILKTANRFWHLPSVDDAKRRLDCKLEKILEEVDKEKPTFRFYTTVKEWEQYRLAINSAEILEIFWKHVEFNNARAREILLPQLKKILEVEATKTPPQTGLAEGKATETPAPQAGQSGKTWFSTTERKVVFWGSLATILMFLLYIYPKFVFVLTWFDIVLTWTDIKIIMMLLTPILELAAAIATLTMFVYWLRPLQK